MGDVIIETPRLLLRRWLESDLASFATISADPAVRRYFPEPYCQERITLFYEAIQREFEDCGYGLYAVEEKVTGRFIGYIGFHREELALDFCPCIEIAWRLDKTSWNKGYATEGAKACLEHGFILLGFDKVYSLTSVLNLPSERVMQKSGMSLGRYFEHPEYPVNHPLRPHVLYEVTPK